MEILDLWGNVLENSKNAEAVIIFLKEQAELLSEKTNNKVFAKFEKINYTYRGSKTSNMTAMLSAVSSTLSALTDIGGTTVEVEENAKLENASSLFKTADYKFEIYSSKYKFRMFTLNYKPIFPLILDVESGIVQENSTKITINDMDELEENITDIFTSSKVKFIIGKMIEAEKNNIKHIKK